MIPRQEHPNPQFERENWINLNGQWEFELDLSASGLDRALYQKPHLASEITVPFCPESPLSGVGNRDFLNCVWYRRDLTVPEDWKNGRVLLHFGAVDYEARIFLNGVQMGFHKGGYVSFTVDITNGLTEGVNSLCVCAIDNTRDTTIGSGKQCQAYHSQGCSYTRTTGIWQTVWMEYVPNSYIKKIRLTPDIHNSTLALEADLIGGGELTAEAFYDGSSVGKITLSAPLGGNVKTLLPLSELHLWEVGNGRLYDLKLTYGEDRVSSYFGMRHLQLDGFRFLINGKSVFQRLVLDQGFYPDGIYTAPSEEALIRDIHLSMEAGFNGARLHQKVFEPRFLYHCDRLGYIVWGEYANWGIDFTNPNSALPLVDEWREILDRDYNHPAIVGWCPLNETWDPSNKALYESILRTIYRMTVLTDPTRPCIDTSGGIHIETDIYDIHDYSQDSACFAEVAALPVDKCIENHRKRSRHHHNHPACRYENGMAMFVSEYGGIKWDINSNEANAWGYGNAPTTEQEFKTRYKALTDQLLDNPQMFGFCYTQLTDVEQEVNGIYTYNREKKFDTEFFHSVNTRHAAIEDD
ncbi:MAG: beta-galactosidase [Ruminococcaceae bacterium]|nr:beta-galactosidase [Oscillospiraceae bacterium]